MPNQRPEPFRRRQLVIIKPLVILTRIAMVQVIEERRADLADESALRVAVFGLGSMGYGIASSILRAGHIVHGFDVVPETMARFEADGGSSGEIAEVAPTLDAVVVVVLNADQTEAVLFGESGIVPQLRSGAVVLSCATVSPEFAREKAAQCEARQIRYLDAPIIRRLGEGGGGTSASWLPEAKPALMPRRRFSMPRPRLFSTWATRRARDRS